MAEQTIGFIGLGLIGGSIARGLKRAWQISGLMPILQDGNNC